MDIVRRKLMLVTIGTSRVNKAIINLPIRLTGNSKRTSGNLFSLLGAQN